MFSLFLLLLQLQSILWLTVSISPSQAAPPIAKPGCKDHCGNVTIPYPFGIGPSCFHDESFEVFCNTSFGRQKLFLPQFNLEVIDINFPGDTQQLRVRTPAVNICRNDDADVVSAAPSVQSVDFRGSPYRFSRWLNVLMVENCGGSVVLRNRSGEIVAGCASYCATEAVNMKNTSCHGIGCCQASLLSSPTDDFLDTDTVPGLDFYQIVLYHQAPISSSTCSLAAGLIDSHSVKKFAGSLSRLSIVPTVLEWKATFITDYLTDHDNFTCDGTTSQCYCYFPYEGNPYLPYGCQVVRECHKCRRHCSRDNKGNYYCMKNQVLRWASILGFSIGMGLILLALSCYWLYRLVKRRKERKQKAKYFKKNGGLLLQQHMSSSDGFVEKSRIFTITELENATDCFSENRILGQGGQGTVYKGMLIDGTIVAIKKSKTVDESQLEQFINEVVILSQINHRNVVKLIGCCLETEVPLLVYELIPNGTLYQHIHYPSEDFYLTWKMRLQLAAESAGALAYLHSSSAAPIYHRDIKSSNILLDDKYRAKVSDFGTSRAITIEQTHVTTSVQGTYGYLDPEYFQSNQFTEKSDVYSFGVVLVELITGKKPICQTESGVWKSLAIDFLCEMENSHLFDIVDTRVLEDGAKEELIAVADLARRCLNRNGKQRPAMKEIALLLDGMRSPLVSSLKEPSYVDNKCLVTEMSDLHTSPFSTSTFFSGSGTSSSFSIEVQPLMGSS